MPSRQDSASAQAVADRLHSAAIHLLRRLRREDDASGLSAPKLSALSVIVFGGPISIGALATAEQVKVPTISRVVASLEADGLVRRVADKSDKRVAQLEATASGKKLLQEGRQGRVAALAADIGKLAKAERAELANILPMLERLSR